MIYDVCTYNGEKDILKLRLEILNKNVDRFVILEAHTTFSGNYKPLYFQSQEYAFKKWSRKIRYVVINENDSTLWKMAEDSPNTKGATHWKREFVQKESIKKALQHLKDDDFCYIADVDEIWDASYTPKMPLERLRLRVYAYYLDNRSSEAFWGILTGRWEDIKDKCLNHLRSDNSIRASEYGGWHFTSMGGFKEVRRKLNDSYTTESYNTFDVQYHLSERLKNGVDYLGRNFSFKIDENEWPEYLHKNREKYSHLCRGVSVIHDSPRGKYNV